MNDAQRIDALGFITALKTEFKAVADKNRASIDRENKLFMRTNNVHRAFLVATAPRRNYMGVLNAYNSLSQKLDIVETALKADDTNTAKETLQKLADTFEAVTYNIKDYLVNPHNIRERMQKVERFRHYTSESRAVLKTL